MLFADLPEHFLSKDWKPPPDQPCIISLLCQKHEGLELEAKVIKEHWWKPHIRKLFEERVKILTNNNTMQYYNQ